MVKVITISGGAQHGKDSTCDILMKMMEQDGIPCLRIAYGDYVKYTAEKFFGWDGNKDEKGRTILQQVGTELGRNVKENIWTSKALEDVQIFCKNVEYILIPDTRFYNEISIWTDNGYEVKTIHVNRIGFDNGLTKEQKQHPSETSLNDNLFNYNISLKGGLEDLEENVHTIYKDLIKKTK